MHMTRAIQSLTGEWSVLIINNGNSNYQVGPVGHKALLALGRKALLALGHKALLDVGHKELVV